MFLANLTNSAVWKAAKTGDIYSLMYGLECSTFKLQANKPFEVGAKNVKYFFCILNFLHSSSSHFYFYETSLKM